jgi:hypothetical protein
MERPRPRALPVISQTFDIVFSFTFFRFLLYEKMSHTFAIFLLM